jgi:hypothetical protein
VHVRVEWLSSDRGVEEYRIVRDGCFRGAIPLPAGATARDVTGLRVQAFPRPRQPSGGPVRITDVNTVFMLDDTFVPGAAVLQWHGVAEVHAGGAPLEIAMK